jgi:hypothetical protein
MFIRFKYILTIVLFIAGTFCMQAQGRNNITEYHLYVQFIPGESFINGKAEIKNPCDSTFLLAKNMKIITVTADGRDVSFFRRPSPNTENSIELTVPGKLPKNLVIVYRGQILPDDYPKNVGSLNMINSALVELSDHIDWYPKSKNNSSFLYLLDVEVPTGFTTITNGFLLDQGANGRYNQTRWKSGAPVYGITLVSAPDLRKSAISGNGMSVEVYYSRLPVSYVDSMKVDLLQTMTLFSDIFGCSPSHNLVRVVYSPRSSGGYARAPLILVSESFALDQINQKFGTARDFRLNAHEIAHYWSRADVGTYDDWINEGLAEYSALLVSEKIIGKAFSDILLDEYIGIVNSSPTTYSIAETPGDSRDREVNRYYKPVLLLNNLQKQYGYERIKNFLRTLYVRFSISGKATTALFLDEVKNCFGTETGILFSEALYKRGGLQQVKTEDIVKSPADTVFAGRWEGPLTQFGTTVRFVLNVKYAEGKLTPSLDSPDQNVTGIPLSDLVINGDSISFRIGVASANYKGRLEKWSNIIHGEFYQRGGTYTLNLTKDILK